MSQATMRLAVSLAAILLGGTWPGAAAAEDPKPAVLFLSRPLALDHGGNYLRQNLARLDRLGYRVAWYSYDDLERLPAGSILQYDTVVFLNLPQVDWTGTRELRPGMAAALEQLRALLRAGGSLLVFLEPSEWTWRAVWPFLGPYGLSLPVGCFADSAPTLAVFNVLYFAYSGNVAPHPLTAGVRGVWYPVGGRTGSRFDFDTLRNANTTPFGVDERWTVLLSTGHTTEFASYEQTDSPFLQQPPLHRPLSLPAPLVAVREGVEGAGRLAVCGINGVFSDFIAGNFVYDGVCTGKGLEGRPSDLDRLLMNTLDWLAAPSLAAGRATLPASLADTFAITPFRFPPPLPVDGAPLLPNPDQYEGLIGARSTYSGGQSTVAEYAQAARELGLDYLVFLEDFNSLELDAFDRFQQECAAHSDDRIILIPGLRLENILGIRYFGFRLDLSLPQPSHLQPGTRLLTQAEAGQYQWAVKNGAREGMALGNYRLDVKEPSGVPASDYNVLNPFISIFTYENGRLADTMLDTFLKCAARTEWVSPLSLHLVDSAAALRAAWDSPTFKTVYLREPGQGLESFRRDLGEHYGFQPITYVTQGPKIEEWRSSGWDSAGEWWDWTRYRWFVRLAVSSEAGLQEVRVLNGTRLFRRFLPRGASRFEETLVLTHHDMHNLILIVTDTEGRQAISDEQWNKNQLLQLTWCADRNNMLSWAGLPAPKSPSGSTGGNFPTPSNLEKGGFRENLVPFVNLDRSMLPGFDGQPYHVPLVSPAPAVSTGTTSEGDNRLARDIGRDLSSPDAAIQTASCRLVYDPSVERPHPWTRGPLVPMTMFHADLSYTTFSHSGHLPAPVLVEGKITILQDLEFAPNVPLPLNVLSMNAWQPGGGYQAFALQHSNTGNRAGLITYAPGVPTPQYFGDFNPGAYITFYPSPFGAVSLISLTEGLRYRYVNHRADLFFDLAGQTVPAGTEFTYRVLVLAGPFDEIATTDLVETFRSQLGLDPRGRVSYEVQAEQGAVVGRDYVLTLDGQGRGFAGEILLPDRFPVSLPVVVENLQGRWTSVLYDRETRRLRPLGMVGDRAYCHRPPEERRGRVFVGHPFTLDHADLFLSVVQTGERELTLQINNPTDQDLETAVRRNPAFDFVTGEDFTLAIPAGALVERVLSAN